MKPVQILAQGDETLQLAAAALLYRSPGGNVYATLHDIHEELGRPTLGPGRPADSHGLSSFAAAVSSALAFRGMVPAGLLYTAPNLTAWWVPAARRRVWLQSQDKRIGDASAETGHPALVFMASPTDWFVYALRDNARPSPSTELQNAPYFNVWDQGRICTGNVELPTTIGPEAMQAYEDAFFRSRFTHPNARDAVRHRGGLTGLWAAQLKNPESPLLQKALAPAGLTLEQAINRIHQRDHK